MPNSPQHQAKADHNRAFLATIDVSKAPDWAAVVAFYTAVHLVERLRTLRPKASEQHSTNHEDRRAFVQRHHRAIHTAYHELDNAAMIARYQTIGSFNSQFAVADVTDALIGQYLVSIEAHVVTVFPPS